MYNQPTLDGFRDYVRSLLETALAAATKAVDVLWAKHAAKGLLNSGGTVKLTIDAVRDVVERTADNVLGQLVQAAQSSGLDPIELRKVVQEELEEFVRRARNATKPEQLQRMAGGVASRNQAISDRLDEIDAIVSKKLRHFDQGFFRPAAQSVPQFTHNTTTVGTMIGGVIQQSGLGSTQAATTSVGINVTEALSAIEVLEATLASAAMVEEARAEVEAEFATLKAQLKKRSPSSVVLKETFRSLRNVVEGAVGGVGASALLALGSALGVS